MEYMCQIVSLWGNTLETQLTFGGCTRSHTLERKILILVKVKSETLLNQFLSVCEQIQIDFINFSRMSFIYSNHLGEGEDHRSFPFPLICPSVNPAMTKICQSQHKSFQLIIITIATAHNVVCSVVTLTICAHSGIFQKCSNSNTDIFRTRKSGIVKTGGGNSFILFQIIITNQI